jgi:NAD(P)-dependent dehydrogenase (short-subunit alcohol dehydrogenase family)
MHQLENTVAVVTGASRGAGRGIAVELGAAGATVYVTGRSVRGDRTREDLPGTTIDDTAEMVTDQGGVGVPVRCDHTVDEQVEALFERVERERGRLDVLVNNAWGGYEGYDETFEAPFWDQPLWRWDAMFEVGARSHFTASRFAVPLMQTEGGGPAQSGGLIVNTTFKDRGKYLGNLPYDLSKAVINRMAYGMALELKDDSIAALALSPGFMRTEAVLNEHDVSEEDWQDDPELERTESPRYIGRAIVALADDPDVLEKSGRTLTVGDLATEYDFTDIDGRQPPSFEIPGDEYESKQRVTRRMI